MTENNNDTMIVYECEQRSDEWFKLRNGVVTASSADKILFAGKRQTFMRELLAEIMTGERKSFAINAAMQWGIDKEDEARIWYEKESGKTVREVGFCMNAANNRIGCSPDGLVENNTGLVEIKCPMSHTHVGYLEDGPPKNYINQMQFQMFVTGCKYCDFVTYDPRMPENSRGKIFRINRDESHISKLRECTYTLHQEMQIFLKKQNCFELWEKKLNG